MNREIERKFLVVVDKLPKLPEPHELTQGYLSTQPAVRVRLSRAPGGEEQGTLTIKGAGLLARDEFEYPIPAEDVRSLLRLCGRRLSKRRYRLGRFELDQFPDRGLWLAEIELASEAEAFDRPDWLGAEVTHDPAYSNSRLAEQVSAAG